MSLDKIKIETGLIQGVPCGNPAYTVFKGIPYAKPPVGEYRWRAPVSPESWEGVRKCDSFPPIAIQRNPTPGEFYQKEFFPVDMPMNEDCLYLNVWTPAFTGNEKLPVMVWIHGGAYMQGYGHEMEFDGEAFCKRGVILVTVNYRLGIFGFFAHPELSARCPHKVSGNYGILDQIQALKWVKQNIEAFGGNSDNVTIFGQSAGGGSVQAIISSTLSEGLFHKAIVQSAGGINTLGGKYTLTEAENFGAEVCDRTNKSVEELMKMPALELFNSVSGVLFSMGGGMPRLMMAPNVDGYILKDSPGDIIASGKHHDVPYMTGSVSGDGSLFGGWPVKNKDEFEKSVKLMHGSYADKYLKLFDVQSDTDLERVQTGRRKAASMLAPRTWAKAHIKLKRKPLYIYYFDRDMPGEDRPGAFHSSELWYIFGTLGRCWRPMEGVDYKISMTMGDYWNNFAKTGDPNGEGAPLWPAFTESNSLTMRINENQIEAVDMAKDPILQGMENLLLHQVYEELGQ
jgi:para-nitrobenzyl esterase